MLKDYYKILGITESETSEEIKRAYRRLARQWHPDVAGNSKNALDKFKEINEAYQILSDKIKREEYDRARMFYSYAKQNSQYNTQGEKHSTYDNSFNEKKSNFKFKNFSFNWENFIYKNTQKQSDKEVKLPINGKDVNTEIEISLSESIEGVTKIINLLQTGTCPKCNGRKFVNGSICPYCSGKGKYTAYKKFTVKIPAGIKNNSKIRLAKEGEVGVNGGLNGDLYITVKIRQEDKYHTEGLNVFQTVPISPSKAVLGGEIKISSLNGEYKVKIAPKTQNGQKIRLSGCGIVQNNKVGDMIITVEIKIPKNLTNEELDLYRKLEQISSENIREY